MKTTHTQPTSQHIHTGLTWFWQKATLHIRDLKPWEVGVSSR